MKSFQEQLHDRNIHIATRYYGPNDLATGWEIRGIVDNQDLFSDLYSQYPLKTLNTLDDYILFLYSRKFSVMSDILPLLLQDDHKKIISKLVDDALAAVESVSNGNLIRYINDHVEMIFEAENSNPDIRYSTLEIIASFANGVSEEVYRYLCDKYGYLLIDRFDSFEKVFEKYPHLFSGLFPTGSLDEIEGFRFETILNIFAHVLNKGSSNLKETVERILPTLCSDAKKLADEKEYRAVMSNERTIAKLYSFLITIRHPEANEFYALHKKVSKQLGDGLEENGQLFSYEIPVSAIIDRYKRQEKWEIRLLSITHDGERTEKSVLLKSRLSMDEKIKSSLIDLVSTNIPTDDFYTMSRQQMLSLISSIGEGTLWGITRDEKLFSDYLSMLLSAISFISEALKCEDEKLKDDMIVLGNMLNLVVSNYDKGEDVLIPFCYSACMFLCALSEKLLRVTYIAMIDGKKYIPIDKVTLGQLLNKDNSELTSIFGEIHINNLAFFLSQVGEKRIGYDYRNSLAHWKDIEPKDVRPQLVLRLLYLFTDILNTVFWHCYEISLKRQQEA
jgi:hypothetical protein